MNRRYLIRPRADRDLDDQADYYGTRGSPALGHRFLLAAHETFTLLASQPEIGWWPKFKNPALAAARAFRVRGFERILVIYRPVEDGVDILRVIHGSRNLQALLSREGLE